MNKIEQINKKLAEANSLLSETQDNLRRNPDDFALQLNLKTIEGHVSELQAQLKLEKELREKEVLELRLSGILAKNGTIPLSILSNISQYISETILSASQHLKLGERSRGPIKKEVIETLDLRFAGISPGSTRIYITGSIAPDLFGFSLIEETLERTYDLLNKAKSDELVDSVTEIGLRSTKNLNNFLKTLSNSNLEIEMKWSSPSDKVYTWVGKQDRILSLSNTLESLQTSHPESFNFSGELIMASLKGQFEIKDDSEKVYKGTFPVDLLEDMKKFHIGDRCNGTMKKTTVKNKITGYQKSYYSLIKIKNV